MCNHESDRWKVGCTTWIRKITILENSQLAAFGAFFKHWVTYNQGSHWILETEVPIPCGETRLCLWWESAQLLHQTSGQVRVESFPSRGDEWVRWVQSVLIIKLDNFMN